MAEQNSSISPRRRLPPLAALRAFEAAARHLSFRAAAEELAVTPTAISHHVRLLEETLGLRLFVRQVRRVALTDAGLRLYPPLREGFDLFERGLADLAPRPARAAVTLTATTLFTARRLIPALGAFRAAYPDLDLRLHASEAVADLGAGVADIAVRYGAGPFPGLVAEALLTERFGILVSPGAGVREPGDLLHVPLLHTEWHRPGKAPDWRKWSRLAGMEGLAITEGPRFTDDGHALQAAVAGRGAVIASLVLAEPELATGLLVNPFGPAIAGEPYHIVATPVAMASPDVLAVRTWLTEMVGARPDPSSARPGAL